MVRKKRSLFLKKLISISIKGGNKGCMEKVFFKILKTIKSDLIDSEKRYESPVDILGRALVKTKPTFKLIKYNKSGKMYNLPFFITKEQSENKGLRWFISESKKRSYEKGLIEQLSYEVNSLLKVNGDSFALRAKYHLYQEGISNRVYLKFLRRLKWRKKGRNLKV